MQSQKSKVKSQNLKIIPPKAGYRNFGLEGGYAALTVTLLTLVVSLTIVGGLTLFTIREVNINRAFTKSIDSYFISEGGIEDALYRVLAGKQLTNGETLGVGKGTTTLLVTVFGSETTIRSEGRRDTIQRNLETKAAKETVGTSFIYGVQVGDGGVEMSNTAAINGSFYSNGPLVGQNSPTITGDVFAASTSAVTGTFTINGNVRAHRIQGEQNDQIEIAGFASSSTLIDDAVVGGSASADMFDDSAISQNAYYQTSISADTTVLGSTIQISNTNFDLPVLPMPISDAQLDQWEQEAQAGGIHTSPCPYELTSGTTNLGPRKIACDMDIKNTAVVNLTGTLWVAGNLTIQNSAIVRLDPAYGSGSGLIIVDDPSNRSTGSILDVKNSMQVLGSGTAGSYVMLVSRNNSAESGGSNDAIEINNTSSAPIYYAPHGSIEIHNSATLKEVTAYKLEIRNSATVTYETGLANVNFSLGPSGGYNVRYWREVE